MEREELHDLCQQVYEKLGWDSEPDYQLAHITLPAYEVCEGEEFRSVYWTNKKVPLYTSDYVLRKLQEVGKTITLTFHSSKQMLATDSKEWADQYTAAPADMRQGDYPYASTAIKALLKLTLALHKAGDLSEKSEDERQDETCTTYYLGVMSGKWKVTAQNIDVATIALRIGKNLPTIPIVAFHEDVQSRFMDLMGEELNPKLSIGKFLERNGDAIKKAIKSIEEIA